MAAKRSVFIVLEDSRPIAAYAHRQDAFDFCQQANAKPASPVPVVNQVYYHFEEVDWHPRRAT